MVEVATAAGPRICVAEEDSDASHGNAGLQLQHFQESTEERSNLSDDKGIYIFDVNNYFLYCLLRVSAESASLQGVR